MPGFLEKSLTQVITDLLTKLFNKSLEIGMFPSDWKRCNVTPVYMSGPAILANICGPCSREYAGKIAAQKFSFYFENPQILIHTYRQGKSIKQ